MHDKIASFIRLMKNELFLPRIIIILITIFILFLSISELKLSDYICDSYILDQVR